MLNDFFEPLDFEFSWDHFKRLPRHPAYRYEYRCGEVHLTGRPRYRQCRISTHEVAAVTAGLPMGFEIRQCDEVSNADLTKVFTRAFARLAPFDSLSGRGRTQACTELVAETFLERHGPVVQEASRVIVNAARNTPVAAAIVTLVGPGDWNDFTDPAWQEAPPLDPIAAHWGQPHLTWMFVDPAMQRKGLGGTLLTHAQAALSALGYPILTSTFLIGDNGSLLWHWKQGFKLIPTKPPA